jgi:hypothetical protein
MQENSTFNTDIYEKAVISFKTEKRILLKLGKRSKMKITRYYILENEHLIYYENTKSQKPRGVLNLYKCIFKTDTSKIKDYKKSLKITT